MELSNTEKFKNKFINRFGEKYDLSKVIYVNAKVKVEVTCRQGHVFYMTPNNLLSGKGCAKCSDIQKGVNEKAVHAEKFLNRLFSIFGDKYDFSLTKYKGADKPVEVVCKKHGKFTTLAQYLLTGRGCYGCGRDVAKSKLSLTTEELVERVISKCENYEACENTKYVGWEIPITLNCKLHGKFETRPPTALKGKGCPHCKEYGYRTIKPGTFYIMLCGEITKIGITNRPVRQRLSKINKDRKDKFVCLKEFNFNEGWTPLYLETLLLKELRTKHKQPIEKFDGSTECFCDVNLEDLISRIETLIKEKTNER